MLNGYSQDNREIDPQKDARQDMSVNRHTVYLALGSNLGEREQNLAEALQHLNETVGLREISALYETEPVGYLEQPRFLNLVCTGTTSLSPEKLLHAAKEIEQTLGRQPAFRNAPRPIDIDILFYDQIIMEEEQLTIPHPRLRERAFVLVPLVEIAPDLVDPISGQTARELLSAIDPRGVKKIAGTNP
jgi:2-amino-4-hydroxy-6-hydroxymethyldihydropteridine diphosphokinase